MEMTDGRGPDRCIDASGCEAHGTGSLDFRLEQGEGGGDAIAYTVTRTHKGDFQGIAPTGRTTEARGVQIARFEDGRIAERWGSSDELGILRQLGVDSTG